MATAQFHSSAIVLDFHDGTKAEVSEWVNQIQDHIVQSSARASRPGYVRFLLDGGATNHCTPMRQMVLTNHHRKKSLSGIVGGLTVDMVDLKAFELAGRFVFATDCLFSEKLALSILSEFRLFATGWRIAEDKSAIWHLDAPTVRHPIICEHNLYWLDVMVPDFDVELNVASRDSTLESDNMSTCIERILTSMVTVEEWHEHRREGHVKILPAGTCEACDRTRRQKTGIRRKPMDMETKQRRGKGVVATDFCGPFLISHGGNKILQPWKRLDNKDLVTTFAANKRSGSAAANLRAYLKVRARPDIVKTDNGNEFIGREFVDAVLQYGMRCANSAEYRAALNGDVEVMNRLLCHGAATLISDALRRLGPRFSKEFLLRFWPRAMEYLSVCMNRCVDREFPTGKHTSHQERTGEKPENGWMVPWFTRGFYTEMTPAWKGSKIEEARRECFLVSYAYNKRTYHVYDVERDVVRPTDSVTWERDVSRPPKPPPRGPVPDLSKDFPVDDAVEVIEEKSEECFQVVDDYLMSTRDPDLSFTVGEMEDADKEFVDRSYLATYEAAHPVSVTLQEALNSQKRPAWLASINEELRGIDGSWKWVRLPPGKKAIPTRLVLVIKNCGRLKSRCVVIGFLQYLRGTHSTYAPTLAHDYLRADLAISAALREWPDAVDVQNAFILAVCEDEVYCAPPKGYIPKDAEDAKYFQMGYVWRLTHALYGMKKAPRYFSNFLSRTLTTLGWVRCPTERSLFLYVKDGKITRIAFFVDDGTISGPHKAEAKQQLKKLLPIKDLGLLKEFLGCQVSYVKDCIRLHQTDYVKRLREKFQVSDRPVPTPIEGKCTSFPESPEVPPESNTFRQILGSIGYKCLMTGPDLVFAQSHFGRWANCVKEEHMSRLKHYLRYVCSTGEQSYLEFRPLREGEKFVISASADSDWRGCQETARSTRGHYLLLNGQLIGWTSKLLSTITHSSTETEFVSLSFASRDVLWLMKLFIQFFGVYDSRYQLEGPPVLEQDNKGSHDTSHGDGNPKALRHLDHDVFGVRELVESGVVKVEKVGTRECAGDLATKPPESRETIIKHLGKYNFYLPKYEKKKRE